MSKLITPLVVSLLLLAPMTAPADQSLAARLELAHGSENGGPGSLLAGPGGTAAAASAIGVIFVAIAASRVQVSD